MSLPKQKAPKGKTKIDEKEAFADPRFAAFVTDPRFRLPRKKNTHVTLDSRFSRILHDEEFSRKATVDRYGRKIPKGEVGKELRRLYRLESEDQTDRSLKIDDDEVRKELARAAGKGYDPAREGGFDTSESGSESDSESESEVGDTGVESHEQAMAEDQITQGEEIPTGEITSRLAAVNMDWDNIRAMDIMAVANSFAPSDGKVLSVAVFPSEFGKERIAREELEGPPKEMFQQESGGAHPDSSSESDSNFSSFSDDSDSDSDSESNEAIKRKLIQSQTSEDVDPSATNSSSTALRSYQLTRLRYYYAIITCSSASTARTLYEAMDGREYLSSANFFDLRFVPDDVSFDDEPRDTCSALERGYKPTEFVTDALTRSKVRLTWDETPAGDSKRRDTLKKAFTRQEADENDLKAYLGSDSEDEDDEAEEEDEAVQGHDADVRSTTSKATTRQARRDSLRAALGLDSEPPAGDSKRGKRREKGVIGDMQITFTPALMGGGDGAEKAAGAEAVPREETTAEKYIRKEKERKAKRREKAIMRREGLDVPEVGVERNGRKNGQGGSAEVEVVFSSEGEGQGEDDDDPFDDPFFTDPVAATAAAREERKAARIRQRKEEEAERAEERAKERAELELVMAEDGIGHGDGDDDAVVRAVAGHAGRVRHFSMKEVEREEKEARKRKGKKRKGDGKREGGDLGGTQDGFRMDVRDPRFARLFVNHEYAIDPTNPRFRDTQGMRALLEEGRKRRKIRDIGAERERKRTREMGMGGAKGGRDAPMLEDLVTKVKRRAGR